MKSVAVRSEAGCRTITEIWEPRRAHRMVVVFVGAVTLCYLLKCTGTYIYIYMYINMCVCVCVWVHVHGCIYMYRFRILPVYVCANVYLCSCMCGCECLYMCVCVCIWVCMCVCPLSYVCVCYRTCVCMCVCVCVWSFMKSDGRRKCSRNRWVSSQFSIIQPYHRDFSNSAFRTKEIWPDHSENKLHAHNTHTFT